MNRKISKHPYLHLAMIAFFVTALVLTVIQGTLLYLLILSISDQGLKNLFRLLFAPMMAWPLANAFRAWRTFRVRAARL